MSEVEWRDIPGFVGYRAGDDGSVWSCWRLKGAGRGTRAVMSRMHWHQLKTPLDNHGYPQLNLRRDGKAVHFKVHQLVALAFLGPKPPGQCVRHLNCDPTDNRPSNLAYGTYQENSNDTLAMGRTSRGGRNYNAKLTDETAMAIRRRAANGERQKDLAAEHGVSATTICKLCSGRVWKHLGVLNHE